VLPSTRCAAAIRKPARGDHQAVLKATCHCGAVSLEIPRRPRQLTSCNCSICRRYGTLWAYYKVGDVRIHAKPRAMESYTWGDKRLTFVRCAKCGCITHWEPVQKKKRDRMGVNTRNLEPETIARVRIRHLDGASTWKFLD
jgi:hypothetical protein